MKARKTAAAPPMGGPPGASLACRKKPFGPRGSWIGLHDRDGRRSVSQMVRMRSHARVACLRGARYVPKAGRRCWFRVKSADGGCSILADDRCT
jgi:hypothetical protein